MEWTISNHQSVDYQGSPSSRSDEEVKCKNSQYDDQEENEDNNSPRVPRWFNLKQEWHKMGSIQLKQMLKDETKIYEDPISVWNRLVNQINNMSIDDDHQIGMNYFCLFIHYNTMKRFYFNTIRRTKCE